MPFYWPLARDWHQQFFSPPELSKPQRFLKDLALCAVTYGLVYAFVAVELEVSSDAAPWLGRVLVRLQVGE
jgi:hypothetical protein